MDELPLKKYKKTKERWYPGSTLEGKHPISVSSHNVKSKYRLLYSVIIHDIFISINVILFCIIYFSLLTVTVILIKINKWFKIYHITRITNN